MESHHSPINLLLEKSAEAFRAYKKSTPNQRKELLYLIAQKLEASSKELVSIAGRETHLSNTRLEEEIKRTAFQLRSYADYMANGLALDIRIQPETQEKTFLGKMNVAMGPVAVFGASNFPFAYSTAGGDTACALAAGCTVIEKGHPAHIKTSRAVSKIISQCIAELKLPEASFQHIEGGFETGEALVKHPLLAAVGFTGSHKGGKQLFDWGNQREIPIPVFAEMGSINPVFLLPQILSEDYEILAQKLAISISQDAGQFCTKPGILVAIVSEGLEKFKLALASHIQKQASQKMLHEGIFENFERNKSNAITHKGIKQIACTKANHSEIEAEILAVETSASYFILHPELRVEVFGPYSLLVVCQNMKDIQSVAQIFDGQLTTSVFGTHADLTAAASLLDTLKEKCGRMILNGVPTGVRVATAMQHGGPYPACTDSRFSSVGADGIRRFMRPVCFQNWPDELLPPELQEANPLKLWRLVDEIWVRPDKK